jgi:hypothetical protein
VAVLFRIVMMIVGYVWACVAASLVLALSTITPDDLAAFGLQTPHLQSVALWWVVGTGALIIFAVAMLPSLLVIALAEGFGLRSIVVYGVIGGILALATAYGLNFAGYIAAAGSSVAREHEVIAAAGIAGGLVYWLFAGRKAGAWK